MKQIDHSQGLKQKIYSKKAQVGIIGLGYVGLPIALSLVDAGFSTCGFDIDSEKVSSLMSGRSYISYIGNEKILESLASKRFRATADYALLTEMDVVLICVPTPLTHHREPDLKFVLTSTETLASYLRSGQLIILESTTYPGTTEEVVRPLLEVSGLKSGEDFYLAYSPEREDPGNMEFAAGAIPKVVGGDGEEALRLASLFYEQFTAKVVPVSNTKTAETVKLVENIFRAVNIALVNELKVVCDAMVIDIWEVIDAAKTKPFGYMPFYPGPGLGGHCIPIDPFYLTWKARELEIHTRFIELAGEINTAMPAYVIQKLTEALSDRLEIGLKGTRVLVLGIAYKKNIDDTRGSASLKIMDLLRARGAEVAFYDPYVPKVPLTRDHPSLAGLSSISWEASELGVYQAALVLTDHEGVDYAALLREVPIVVDTRNAMASLGDLAKSVIKA